MASASFEVHLKAGWKIQFCFVFYIVISLARTWLTMQTIVSNGRGGQCHQRQPFPFLLVSSCNIFACFFRNTDEGHTAMGRRHRWGRASALRDKNVDLGDWNNENISIKNNNLLKYFGAFYFLNISFLYKSLSSFRYCFFISLSPADLIQLLYILL